MAPVVSKLRQYILFVTVFTGLLVIGRFGQTPLPDHRYFQKISLNCHPFRRVPHLVTLTGVLPWEESWFDPIQAQEQILDKIMEFHEGHNPPLKPRKDWPRVEVLSIERREEKETSYLVHWKTLYEVEACKKLGPTQAKYENLTALVQRK